MKVSHGRLAGSSRNDEAAARIAEGHAVAAERDARASGIIQKLERPLRHDYEYTIRRVDRRHPHRPTCFSLGEKQSMVNCNEIRLSGHPSFMKIGFGTISKLIGISPSSRIGRIPSPHSCMLIGRICNRSIIQCSTKSSPKLNHMEILILLACIRTGTQN
jgi:hypothetical protein